MLSFSYNTHPITSFYVIAHTHTRVNFFNTNPNINHFPLHTTSHNCDGNIIR